MDSAIFGFGRDLDMSIDATIKNRMANSVDPDETAR